MNGDVIEAFERAGRASWRGCTLSRRARMLGAAEILKRHAWSSAGTATGLSAERWRVDAFGNLMRRGSYGTKGAYGWTVDLTIPIECGGELKLRNIRAIHNSTHRAGDAQMPRPKFPEAGPRRDVPAAAAIDLHRQWFHVVHAGAR